MQILVMHTTSRLYPTSRLNANSSHAYTAGALIKNTHPQLEFTFSLYSYIRLFIPPHERDLHREGVLAYALRGDNDADHAFKRHARIDGVVVDLPHAVAQATSLR